MRKLPLVGESERRTHKVLEESLTGTQYIAAAKVRVRDVLRADDNDQLWSGERNVLAMGHFDFVVYERRSWYPVFALEYDGPYHDRVTQRNRDRCKNRLCWRAGLPLLRVTRAEIAPHERVSILGYMLRRFLAWPADLPRIKAEIVERTPRFEPGEWEALTADEQEDFVDEPTLDPGFIFDLEHPYPGNEEISRRLLDRFEIEVAQKPGSGLSFYAETPLRCHILPAEMSWPGHHCLRGAFSVVYEHEVGADESFRSTGDGYEAVGGRTLYRGHREFSIRWTLPVDEDDSFVRHMVFAELPGINIPHITRELCIYFTLRDVEDWAERGLVAQT